MFRHGGSIADTKGLRHILSIGYEVECGVLAKFTRTEIDVEPGEIVLYNTDTARKDVDDFKRLEEDSDADVDDSILERQEEIMEDVIFDRAGKPDKNAVFNITSDIAMTPFIKMVDKLCYYESDLDPEASFADKKEEKNNFFVFRDESGKDYKIRFMLGYTDDAVDANQSCALHTSVEWVITYYKPQRSKNVVVDTFVNMISNLVRHLSDLESIRGTYIVKSKEGQEFVVEHPRERILFHKPGTNLYYLQTQKSSMPLTIDDACSVVQMTFSANAEHIINVLISLLSNTPQSIASFSEDNEAKLNKILLIQMCVNNLVDNYNANTAMHHILSDTKKNAAFSNIVKTHIFLILYKIVQYMYFKSNVANAKYLKDVLYFNSRHSNYDLYMNLKRQIKTHFGIDDERVIAIIKDIIFVPQILGQLELPREQLRRGVFSKTNVLDKTNRHYGDPGYSLVSYFDFFEQPIAGEIIYHDWLEYTKVDNLSNRMELKGNVILIECRNFQKMLALYVYDIADTELKKQMTRGACNILTKHIGSDVSSMSIANFKKIIELYNNKFAFIRTRTTKKRKSKSKDKGSKGKASTTRKTTDKAIATDKAMATNEAMP